MCDDWLEVTQQSTTMPLDQRKRKLYGTVLVHCIDVSGLLAKLRGEKKPATRVEIIN